ncbi:MAG: ABC transporter substrate-binding protein [Candidatus Nanopelagicales bacterium]
MQWRVGAIGALCLSASLAVVGTAVPSAALADPLILGTALPDTGPLKAYGPATQAAVALAVGDANAEGGVLGSTIMLSPGDSGHTGSGVFAATLNRLAGEGVQAVIGPMSSDLVLQNADAVRGRTLVSPATTNPALAGLISQVTPASTLEGVMLAKLADERDVRRLVAVAPRSQREVAEAAADAAELRGMQAVVVLYSRSQSASKIAAKIRRSASDGLMLATDDKTNSIVQALIKRGMPANVLLTTWAAKSVNPKKIKKGALRGAITIEYDLIVPRSLKRSIGRIAPEATTTAYSPQAYDAAAITILAAEQSGQFLGEITPAGIRAALASVTSGGISCTTLRRCLTLAQQGRDIAYVGYTGPLDLNDEGQPEGARYIMRTYGANNVVRDSTRAVRLP